MPSLSWIVGFLWIGVLVAQPLILPLREVRAGMRGVGKTVFSGTRVEEFQVEVLGVLENSGPKQSVILARLSGGPLASAGVMQGMSGSPVYIGGKLVGAVAFAFQFAKEPIAGVRPIEEMLRVSPPVARGRRAALSPFDRDLTRPLAQAAPASEGRIVDIATPVSFGGFTRAAIETFAPQLRELGLDPRAGTGGGASQRPAVAAEPLQPGSMISVQLVSGDMNVSADGTVTMIDGKRIYAFGHRFLSIGPAELPFARAEVLTVLPTLSSSFKISTAREWLGSITMDASTAVMGELGRRAPLVPVTIAVNRGRDGADPEPFERYQIRIVNDPLLAPLLLQIAAFSAIDATERTVGASTFAIHGRIEFQGGAAPVRIENMYSGDANMPMQVSLAAAVPVAYAMQSGFTSLKLKSVDLTIDSSAAKRQWQIDQIWTSRPRVRPGDTVDLYVLLAGEDGAELKRKVSYQVPPGAPNGPLYFTVADGLVTNMTEFGGTLTAVPRSAAQVVTLLNSLRANTGAYVRVWRAEPAFQVQGEDLPDPPPSVAMILTRSAAAAQGAGVARNSKVAELQIGVENAVVSGYKTLQVEVKE
ncbi:MAG: hypothetical protein LLG20_07715 [Acidobacteriales bacterium]|nr:hypothetical protein [Terriglobales bacterium]